VAVIVSKPWAREFAGIVNAAEPALKALGPDMYEPLTRAIVPVAAGMGFPVFVPTETVKVRG
jgi:hypothetical protein